MKFSRWAFLFLVASVGLFGQRAAASYTRLDTGLHARKSALLQATATAQDEQPADAIIVESIIPLGTTADGQPLALISLLIPTAHLAEHTPTSTRAGPYAAPETHTRVFCIVQPPLGLYAEAGHYYTVYYVARAAGRSHEQASSLAFYAQAPDLYRDFDALGQIGVTAVAPSRDASRIGRGLLRGARNTAARIGRGDFSAPEMQIPQLRELVPHTSTEAEWLKEVVHKTLHSLGGTDAIERREILERMFRSGKYTEAQQGLILHAFGDAFGHSYEKDGRWILFPAIIGHALEGKDPDAIGKRFSIYAEYVSELYSLLGGTGSSEYITKLLQVAKGLQTTEKYDFDHEVFEVGRFVRREWEIPELWRPETITSGFPYGHRIEPFAPPTFDDAARIYRGIYGPGRP